MSTFEDGIWTHLVDRHSADSVDFRVPSRPSPVRQRGVAFGVIVLVAVIAAAALMLRASTGAPPAYALTGVAGGAYTVSLNDLATGIPALNARFAHLGIRETVVRVTAHCTASSFDPIQVRPEAMTRTVTVNNREIPPGYRGFIAAERLPDGRVRLAQGTTAEPIPSCFSLRTSSGIPQRGAAHGGARRP
jgi:hypothetical protein